MTSDDFNPNSPNAMFATVLTKLEALHQTCSDIRHEQKAVAEDLREEHRRALAGLAGHVSAVEERTERLKSKVDINIGKVMGAAAVVGAISGIIAVMADKWIK